MLTPKEPIIWEECPKPRNKQRTYKYYSYIRETTPFVHFGTEQDHCECSMCKSDNIYRGGYVWVIKDPKEMNVWENLFCEDCFQWMLEESKEKYIPMLVYRQ